MKDDAHGTTSVPASIAGLRAALDDLREDLVQVTHERDVYKSQVEFFQRELERLRDLQKTPREHVDPDQIQLAFAQLEKQLLEMVAKAREGSDDTPKRTRKRTPHGRAQLPEHLPVKTIFLDPHPLPSDASVIGQEVSWRLAFQPARFLRLKVVRRLFAVDKTEATKCTSVTVSTCDGNADKPAAEAKTATEAGSSITVPVVAAVSAEAKPGSEPDDDETEVETTFVTEAMPGASSDRTIVYAPASDEMIPRGLPSVDLLAHVMTNKFADKLPFNRQEGIFAREGVHITRGTMCGWAERCHALAKVVVDAMSDEARAKAHYICTDATGVLVQANDRCKKGHFWVLVAERDHVIFRYSKRHSSDEPKRFLAGFKGTVIADASNVYDALFRDDDGPDEGGCNAHARRYFYKALASDRDRALIGIGFFNELFDIERAIGKGLPPSKVLERRRERAGPVVEALKRWRDEQLTRDDVADGTPIRKALNYLRNHWDALTRFLHDGKIPIHNNWSELELRRMVIGRANWLFVGSDESAEWTCTFVSLVASCQLHGLDPQSYLRDLFRVLPVWPKHHAIELAPKYWRATRERLVEDELALPLGPITVPPQLANKLAVEMPA